MFPPSLSTGTATARKNAGKMKWERHEKRKSCTINDSIIVINMAMGYRRCIFTLNSRSSLCWLLTRCVFFCLCCFMNWLRLCVLYSPNDRRLCHVRRVLNIWIDKRIKNILLKNFGWHREATAAQGAWWAERHTDSSKTNSNNKCRCWSGTAFADDDAREW